MANDKKGILGEKLGMTQVFDENNRIVPVTVVKAGPCVVTQIRTAEKDGYTAVQLAYGQIDPRKVTKPVAGHFKAADVTPRRHLVELRTDALADYTVGRELSAGGFAHWRRVRHPLGRPAGRDLRRQDQRVADPPGRRRAAGRGPAGHARHEDARRGPRWRQEAVPPEGHRPRPPGFDPCAAVHRRWHRARP